jgi:hypothetical protein
MVERLVRVLALVAALGMGGCSRAPPPAPPPLPSGAAEALSWLPADVAWITHQGPGQIALIQFARSALKDRGVACFERLSGQADHLFMFSRFLGDPALNAVHGFSDREATESCVAEVYEALSGQRVTLDRSGALTRASAGSASIHLGWSSDGWLYFDKDRGRVESMLSRPGASMLAPRLRPLLSRVSLDGGFWTVFGGDLSGPFIGVPSTGFIQRLSLSPGKGTPRATGVPITFLFESEADARRAVEELESAARNEEFPPALRSALAGLHPTVRGTEVDADAALLMTDIAAMEAAGNVMKARLARRQRAQ